MKPILAITVGDPAGIGPEICLKALNNSEMYTCCTPVLIGDTAPLEQMLAVCKLPLKLNRVAQPKEARGVYGVVDYIDCGIVGNTPFKMGEVSALCGEAAFQYVIKGIELAMAKEVKAVVTGPLNKEAMNLAGHHYSGHTEIFAEYTHTKDSAMLLASRVLRVIHVTTHVSMRNACDLITKDRVLRTIRLAKRALEEIGIPQGTIAVAGLNAHCSENGLFGTEEHDSIEPAIEAARAEGILVDGPIPPDTVFVKAMSGKYPLVVAMYHDQGHIPLKLSGFKMDAETGVFTSVNGINCTIGLPIIRTSVDHGTAFDKAGKGEANEESVIDAMNMAITMAQNRFPEG